MIFSKMESNGTIDINNLSTGAIFASLLILTLEVIDFLLLGLGVTGMYKGIEIAHPVYSVLFLDICFNFVMALSNLVSINFLPLFGWVRLTIYPNCFGIFFHHSRFAIKKVSVIQCHDIFDLNSFLLQEVYYHFHWCRSTIK